MIQFQSNLLQCWAKKFDAGDDVIRRANNCDVIHVGSNGDIGTLRGNCYQDGVEGKAEQD